MFCVLFISETFSDFLDGVVRIAFLSQPRFEPPSLRSSMRKFAIILLFVLKVGGFLYNL